MVDCIMTEKTLSKLATKLTEINYQPNFQFCFHSWCIHDEHEKQLCSLNLWSSIKL